MYRAILRLMAVMTAAILVASLAPVALGVASPAAPATDVGVPAADVIPVTLTLSVESDPLPAGPIFVTATLAPNPGGGTVRWAYDNVSNGTSVAVGPDGIAPISIPGAGVGAWHIYATFDGFGTYGAATDDIAFSVATPTTTTLAVNRTSAVAGELPVVLTAKVTVVQDGTTTVTYLDDVNGAVVELGPFTIANEGSEYRYSTNKLRVGTHSITARFNGAAGLMASTSAPVTVVVAPDTSVHATFRASYATFYPYKDGYRDTVTLGGVLDESASVSIRIYNSASTLKRTYSLGTKGPGKYSAAWNGRTASGVRLPAGTYTVKASFKDARSHTRTIKARVAISNRQVTWKSATQLKYGDEFAYSGTGRVKASPDFGRGRAMYTSDVGIHSCDPCIQEQASRTVQLKSTALAVRNVTLDVCGHGFMDDYYNTGTIFLVNPVTGARFSTGFPPPEDPGCTELSVGSAYVNASKQFHLVIWETQDMGDAFDLHGIGVLYQYAVWK